MDDGNFHTILQAGDDRKIDLTQGIPVCCKLSVDQISPPLKIKIVNKNKASNNMSLYTSFKVT